MFILSSGRFKKKRESIAYLSATKEDMDQGLAWVCRV